MTRATFQILVLPFRRPPGGLEFAALRRSDDGSWQGIAGGGERGESPEQAAIREAVEEAGLPATLPFYRLQTTCSVPVHYFAARRYWPADLYVISEYAFAVDCTGLELRLSAEHKEKAWGSYNEIDHLLRWDSNKTALWELHERLRVGQLGLPLRP